MTELERVKKEVSILEECIQFLFFRLNALGSVQQMPLYNKIVETRKKIAELRGMK